MADFLDDEDDDGRPYCRPVLTCGWCGATHDPDLGEND